MSESWLQKLVGNCLPIELWADFHTNTRNVRGLLHVVSNDDVQVHKAAIGNALSYPNCEKFVLSRTTELSMSLQSAIARRCSVQKFAECEMTLPQLSALLGGSYGETHILNSNSDQMLRAVPSAGALYPLEILVYCQSVNGLPVGLYHYSPKHNELRRLPGTIDPAVMHSVFMQPELVSNAAVVVLVLGVLQRSTFKYGQRAYRYALIECGHLCQNLNLIANALHFDAASIGSVYDEELDALLGFDGINLTVLHCMSIGKSA